MTSTYMDDYATKWKAAQILEHKQNTVIAAASMILANWQRYANVGKQVSIPAYIIGCIHSRESDFDFDTHLANGDPLFDHNGTPIVTTHVPAGIGPFKNWEEGAIAALDGYKQGYHWDICNALENLELYNGAGYRHMGIPSPYIWSYTNQYTNGKYVADGIFSPTAVDEQVGCAAILLALKAHGVDVNDTMLT